MNSAFLLMILVIAFVAACGDADLAERRSEPESGSELALAEDYLPRLAVGQAVTVDVFAVKYWNFAVQAQAGDLYTISTPAGAGWVDYFIPSGAVGYTTEEAPLFSRGLLKAFEPFRRLPQDKWFVLSACVGFAPENCFVIGASGTKKVAVTGPLSFFANDVPVQYYNNSGKIKVTIRRDK